MLRIALGGFVQETNSFSPIPGSWLHFPPEQLFRGEQMLSRLQGTRTEIGGIVADAGGDIELVPLFHAMTTASAGPLAPEVFDALLGEILDRLRAAGPLDGVLLVLHGAMATATIEDATGAILAAVRAVIGPDLPLVATLDLHANVTAAMVQYASALVGYHTAPHIDLYETGQRGLALLRRILSGTRPAVALRRLPMIVPAENGQTTEGPFAEVFALAYEQLRNPAILDISLFSMQPWLDVEDAGCSVLVTTDSDHVAAGRVADELAAAFWQRRHAFAVTLEPTVDALARALAAPDRPHILADSADAPSSGAPGDSTVVLHHLLAMQPQQLCLLNIVDADAVAQLVAAGVGNQITLRVGAGSGVTFYQKVDITGIVERISDGAFTNKGQGFQGMTFQRGRTVVLRSGQIALVVMERPVIQWDPELYRSVGLEPQDAQIVVVKSPAAFRAAYGPFAATISVIDAPGVCSPNIAALPFRRVRRPMWPFDTIVE